MLGEALCCDAPVSRARALCPPPVLTRRALARAPAARRANEKGPETTLNRHLSVECDPERVDGVSVLDAERGGRLAEPDASAVKEEVEVRDGEAHAPSVSVHEVSHGGGGAQLEEDLVTVLRVGLQLELQLELKLERDSSK